MDCVHIQANPAQVIYDGQHPKCPPFKTVAPPVTIFHPIFDAFLSRHHTAQPSKEDLVKTQELIHVASEIYANEKAMHLNYGTSCPAFLCPRKKTQMGHLQMASMQLCWSINRFPFLFWSSNGNMVKAVLMPLRKLVFP